MKYLLSDVADFHQACDVPIRDRAGFPDEARVRLRCDLIEEEAGEFMRAAMDGDLVGAADGLADLIYVAVGAALEFGIPLDEIWDEVQAANMAKVCPETGKVRRRGDGKVLKPKDWKPPNLIGIISRAMMPKEADRG